MKNTEPGTVQFADPVLGPSGGMAIMVASNTWGTGGPAPQTGSADGYFDRIVEILSAPGSKYDVERTGTVKLDYYLAEYMLLHHHRDTDTIQAIEYAICELETCWQLTYGILASDFEDYRGVFEESAATFLVAP